ncbi:MAG: S24/S26 family peptidase [Prevotella sp.]|nr:S24/S26 family peptidase [Prevotella sp.]MCF0208980.1 S24/S26 family peptidase [Bacteroidaceae bacterium]
MEFNNAEFLPLAVSYLETKESVKIPLKGYSMRPFLESERDYAVLCKPHKPVLYEPVLALLPDQRWVLHRIIKIEGENITMLGDGNIMPEYCKASDIQASILGFYRKGRNKIDLISGRKWKIYSFFWIHLRPIRRYLLFINRVFFCKSCQNT